MGQFKPGALRLLVVSCVWGGSAGAQAQTSPAAESLPEGDGAVASEEPLESPPDPFAQEQDDEDHTSDAPIFDGPRFRAGAHVWQGMLVGDRNGVLTGLEVLAGLRLTRSWSVMARANGALGTWHAAGNPLLTSFQVGAGVEYLLHRVQGPGTALAAGMSAGVWGLDGNPSPLGQFMTFATLTPHLGLLFAGSHSPENPLAAFAVGLSGSVGSDLAGTTVGSLGLYLGWDFSS